MKRTEQFWQTFRFELQKMPQGSVSYVTVLTACFWKYAKQVS